MMDIRNYVDLAKSAVESSQDLPLYTTEWGAMIRSQTQGLCKVTLEGLLEAQKRIQELEQENIDLRDRLELLEGGKK